MRTAANPTRYREELVQVAAVAVAILEQERRGRAYIDRESDDTWLEVVEERVRQNEKWGPQRHDPQTWMLILMEEIGELADEITGRLTGPFEIKDSMDAIMIEIGRLGQICKFELES